MTTFKFNAITGKFDLVRNLGTLDDRYVLEEDMWLMPPVEDFYDPTGGLPADPAEGDRYISEATANGWTTDYVYEWDGSEWVESVPEEGWLIWELIGLIFWVFFSGGWMEVGSDTFVNESGDTMTGDLLVGTDSSYDLGSTTKFWQFIYTDGIQLNANASIVGTVRNDKMTFNIANNGYYEWKHSGNTRMQLSDNILQVIANIISGNDSTKTLGTSSNYWLGTYTDKLWLNATATLDGATAGVTTLTGALKVGGNVGFYGTTPVTQPSAYTPTNVVTDRSYDANATTTEELADVLGTLIADLQSSGLIG